VDLCILEPFCNCSTVGCTLLDNIGPDPLRAPPSTGVQLEFAGESAFGTIPLADGIHAFTLTRSAE
jgi:hypothetical protein